MRKTKKIHFFRNRIFVRSAARQFWRPSSGFWKKLLLPFLCLYVANSEYDCRSVSLRCDKEYCGAGYLEETILSLDRFYDIRCIFIGHADQRYHYGSFAGSKFGMGTILYPAYYALSVIARILFAMAYISFAVTMTILTRNAITGVVFGLVIPNIPQILEMVLDFLRIHIDLDFFKISTHMPSVYAASNDLSSFLPCFVVLCGYLILSVLTGFRLLKHQDIKWFKLEYLHKHLW